MSDLFRSNQDAKFAIQQSRTETFLSAKINYTLPLGNLIFFLSICALRLA